MKKILCAFFAALLTLGVFTSCNKDETDLENVDFKKEIIGTWRAYSYVYLFNGEIISEDRVYDYNWTVIFTKEGLFRTSDGEAGAYKVKDNLVFSLNFYEYAYQITSYDGKRLVCQDAECLEVENFDIKNPVDTFKGQKIYRSLYDDDTYVYLKDGKTPTNCYTGKFGKGVYYEDESVVMVREK